MIDLLVCIQFRLSHRPQSGAYSTASARCVEVAPVFGGRRCGRCAGATTTSRSAHQVRVIGDPGNRSCGREPSPMDRRLRADRVGRGELEWSGGGGTNSEDGAMGRENRGYIPGSSKNGPVMPDAFTWQAARRAARRDSKSTASQAWRAPCGEGRSLLPQVAGYTATIWCTLS